MDWKIQRFGDVCKFVRGPFGGSLKKNIFKEEGYAVYEQKHAIYDQFTDIRYFVDKEKFDEMIRFELFSGDLIMSCSGTMGKIAIVPPNIPRGIINQALLKLTPNKALSSEFLKLWMESRNFQEQIEQLSQGAAIKNMASVKILKEIKVPTPSESEQKRIVALLDIVFADLEQTRAKTEQNLKNARELFDSYLQQVFSQKDKVFPYEKIEDLTTLITKGSSPKWQGINYVEEPGVLFVTSENVGVNKMIFKKIKYVEDAFNEKHSKSILVKGDVLTNIVGASIGRTAIFDQEQIANINQAVCLMRCNPEILFNEYLSYLLNSPYLVQVLHDNEIDNARANLSLGFFRKLEIPVPSIEVQKGVVDDIKAMHLKTDKLEVIYQKKLAAIDELKKSILQKAFGGELTKTVE